MNKFFTTLFALAVSASAMALPVGNVWDASLYTNSVMCPKNLENTCSSNWCDNLDWRVGFYGDYSYNKHLRNKSENAKSTIHETSLMTNAGIVVVNFCQSLDLYVTLGTTQIAQISPQSAYIIPGNDEPNSYNYIQTDTDFSWSVGGRMTLFEWGCFAFGGGAQYFQTKPDLISIRVDGGIPDYAVECCSAKYWEWQLDLGLAYRVNIVDCGTAAIPYAAIRYGRAAFDAGDVQDRAGVIAIFDQENDRDWGWAFGVTLLGCNRWSVTAEGRWANEKALHVNTQFAF